MVERWRWNAAPYWCFSSPSVTMDEHVYSVGVGMERVANLHPGAEVWSAERDLYVDNPPLAMYYFGSWAHLGKMLGASGYSGLLYWARIGAVLLGVAAVLLTYLLGKRLLGETEGLMAGTIMAVLPLSVGWSRLTYIAIALIAAYTAVVALFVWTRDWEVRYRLPLLALAAGIPFATKYNGIFAAPLLAFLWVLYEQPLPEALGRDTDWTGNRYVARFIDFVLLSGAFTAGAYVVLVATFPYLWRAPVRNFINIFLMQSSRGSLGIIGILQSVGSVIIYHVVRNPLPVVALAVYGLYVTVQETTRDRLAIAAWGAAPLLIAFLGFGRGKYTLPLIVPLSLLAALGLSQAYDRVGDRIPVSYSTTGMLLAGYLAISVILVYPYIAAGYYSGIVGFAPGAWKLGTSHDWANRYIGTPGGYGSGVGEGMKYIWNTAPRGATVQIYTQLQPFYIGIDRTVQYLDPTKPPRADYVLINSLYSLGDTTEPGWWFIITGRPGYNNEPNRTYYMTYEELEENPNYRRVWQDGVMGVPMARVYRRVS
ncbi:MAG: glycosyltransferase family 39 protein [Candidatus Nanohaloarchaea archaeon]|nr:glycosyltransferase family 39 protein [Candidatus Nanohaloarchaea archaeon]